MKLLPAPELKSLARDFLHSSVNQSKAHLINSLCKHSRQKSVFSFSKGAAAISNVIERNMKAK